jgi:hypothetical protein
MPRRERDDADDNDQRERRTANKDEQDVVALAHSATVTPPPDCFIRERTDWRSRGNRNAAGITFVPSSADKVYSLVGI